MTHGIFNTLEKAEEIMLNLRTNEYKNDYNRTFFIHKVTLNQIYKSGASFA